MPSLLTEKLATFSIGLLIAITRALGPLDRVHAPPRRNSSTMLSVQAGERIDRYVLAAPLGAGGQGSVWKATDALDGQLRALKLVEVSDTRSNQLERARREARALAALSHPSLVRCHGLFEDLSRSTLGIVLDFVEGPTLASVLEEQQLSAEQRTWVARHIAHAVAYLHAQSMLHRDLKPQNVLLAQAFWSNPADPAGVKVVDFGIAVRDKNPSPLTVAGHVVGTPAYMAPEMLDPTRFGALQPGPASDVFAYGVILWQLMGGVHPTGLSKSSEPGEYLQEYRRFAEAVPPWLARVPPGPWHDLARGCLAPHVSRRLADGSQLCTHLDTITTALPSIAPPATDIAGAAPPTSLASSPPATQLSQEPTAYHAGPPGAPRVTQSQPDRSGPSPLLRWGGLFGLGAVLTLGAASAWWVMTQSEAPAPHATVTDGGTADGTTSLTPTEIPTTQPEAPFVCQEENGRKCPSGSDCWGHDCEEGFAPDEVFDLRVSGVGPLDGNGRATEIMCKYPDATVCFNVDHLAADPPCTPLKETMDNRVAMKSIRVKARQLGSKGIDVTILDRLGGRPLGTGSLQTGKLTHAMLCKGLSKDIQLQGEIPKARVSFFLDNPRSTPKSRCAEAQTPCTKR